MERLTEHIENNKIYLKDLDEGLVKLAEYEDFMEQHCFKSLEDLTNSIGFIRFSDGYNEETHEQIHKQEFIKYSEAYIDKSNSYKNLCRKYQSLKLRLYALNDFVDKFADEALELINNSGCDDLIPAYNALMKVKERVQELNLIKNLIKEN